MSRRAVAGIAALVVAAGGVGIAFAAATPVTSRNLTTQAGALTIAPQSHTVTLTATADAYVQDTCDGGDAGTSYGSAAVLRIRAVSPCDGHAFVRFDLGELPAGLVDITSAQLALRCTSTTIGTASNTAARSYEVAPVTSDWAESTLTYAAQPGVLGTTGAGTACDDLIDGGPGPGNDVTWDVTGDVHDDLLGTADYSGWKASDGDITPQDAIAEPITEWASREAGGSGPRLVVTYTI